MWWFLRTGKFNVENNLSRSILRIEYYLIETATVTHNSTHNVSNRETRLKVNLTVLSICNSVYMYVLDTGTRNDFCVK